MEAPEERPPAAHKDGVVLLVQSDDRRRHFLIIKPAFWCVCASRVRRVGRQSSPPLAARAPRSHPTTSTQISSKAYVLRVDAATGVRPPERLPAE